MATPTWVSALRHTVKDAGFREGWSVLERRGRVGIQRSWQGPDGIRQKKSISTQINWAPGCTSAVLEVLNRLKGGIDRGLSIDEAAGLLLTTEATNSTHQRSQIDWDAALEKWRKEKLSMGMKPRTFERNDWMRMQYVLKRVNSSHVENGKAFVRLAPFNPQGVEYPGGSTSRRCYVNTVCQFLQFCVEELGFDEKWNPPLSRRKLKGNNINPNIKGIDKPANSGKAIPFPEEAIKPLMESFPDTSIGRKWRLATGLIVCYGLRGVELNHLRFEDGQLWCDYVKRNSTGQTKPRILIGVDPEDMPGLSKQLLAEWLTGMTTIPRAIQREDAEASLSMSIYLGRRPLWVGMKKAAKEQGRRLSIYSFRHRYSKALDAKGFTARTSAVLMGHSRHTFETHYADGELNPQELLSQAAALL